MVSWHAHPIRFLDNGRYIYDRRKVKELDCSHCGDMKASVLAVPVDSPICILVLFVLCSIPFTNLVDLSMGRPIGKWGAIYSWVNPFTK